MPLNFNSSKLKPYHANMKDKDGSYTNWALRHNAAIRNPEGLERGLMRILRGWEDYADQHRTHFGSLIGEDGFLGPQWEAIGDALRSLLNGSLGRLDGGVLDSAIQTIMNENAINTEGK